MRVILVAFAALALAACSSQPIERFENTAPRLQLEEYFDRPMTAWGIFEGRGGHLKRSFTVALTPSWDGTTLTLQEDFVYDDGEESQRIWRFRKESETRYVGTAGDVIGEAEVRVAGKAATFSYLVDLELPERTVRLRFTDWLYLEDEAVLINRARVSKWGFDVGSVTVFFHRPS
jgi:hypothetical protein